MTGAKGRGGARPGAGRKPKKIEEKEDIKEEILEGSELMDGKKRDPLEFLLLVQNNPAVDPRLRVRAAIAAAQYLHTKTHDGGKKEERQKQAEKVASKFSPASPPKLVASGGRKV